MKLLTLQQAAQILSISMPTIRAWVWKKKIEHVRIGRCVRIKEETVKAMIDSGTSKSIGGAA